MTPTEFILKWEEEIHEAEAQWKMACKFGDSAELIEGARMQGTAKMIDEYYDAHKIMPRYIRRMPDISAEWEKQGWVNPEKA